ncbi:MAG: glucosamine--fructose-6-phosphate aminotransferase [Planctomycetaceae bacterium]|nr:glucosamine--fructose-6-phosphate aminotransferase [Planctomycetaceae bacterium]
MIPNDARYTKFGLIEDMLAVPELIRSFDAGRMQATAQQIAKVGRLLLTGEGSSRLFPGKNVIAEARRQGWPLTLHTETGLQAQEYDLADWAVFAQSNSGRTAEVIGLFDKLHRTGHPHRYSLCAHPQTKLESLANTGYVLTCGEEHAVAASKSVIEQALFLRALLEHAAGEATLASQQAVLAQAFQTAVTTPIDQALVERIARAKSIYWAGRNDGVAEELTLKTNEITRKSADFLEGTYAVHGIEEVMDASDVLIWVNPYAGSEDKFHKTLVEGVGLTIIAIASRPTRFPTIIIPDVPDLTPFVEMAAGWNLIVEVGLLLAINLDKPLRARKVGNEFE